MIFFGNLCSLFAENLCHWSWICLKVVSYCLVAFEDYLTDKLTMCNYVIARCQQVITCIALLRCSRFEIFQYSSIWPDIQILLACPILRTVLFCLCTVIWTSVTGSYVLSHSGHVCNLSWSGFYFHLPYVFHSPSLFLSVSLSLSLSLMLGELRLSLYLTLALRIWLSGRLGEWGIFRSASYKSNSSILKFGLYLLERKIYIKRQIY